MQNLPLNTDLQNIDLDFLNNIANAHACLTETMKFKHYKCNTYPNPYIVTEDQINEAKKVKESKRLIFQEENKHNLFFCGRGWHKAENTADVTNCRISTILQLLNGDRFYLEFSKAANGFVFCNFSMDLNKQAQEEKEVQTIHEQMKQFAPFSDEVAELIIKRKKIQKELYYYNAKGLEKELYKKSIEWNKENILNIVNTTFNTDFKTMIVDNFLNNSDQTISIQK